MAVGDRDRGLSTRVMLIKGAESKAVLEMLADGDGEIAVTDKGAYWQLESPGDIVLSAEAVSEYIGHDITVDDLQVIFATYVGRILVDDEEIRVTSELPQMGM